MNKLEKLEEAIRSIPDEYNAIRNALLNAIDSGGMRQARDYNLGLYDMARHLTSDEALLEPLRHVQNLLR